MRGFGLLGVVGMVLAACHGEPARDRDETVLRLDGRSFGSTTSAIAPLVEIGGVALPVPYARDVHRSALVESSPARAGRVHALMRVPEHVAGWPRSAFALRVRADIGSVAPKMDRTATETFDLIAVRPQDGWRVRFDPRRPGRGKVTATVPAASEGRTSLVELEAIAPMPRHLKSGRFDLPPGSVLTLQYGLAARASRAPATPVCFRATLGCAWWWTRTLVSDCVTVGDPGSRWHEVEFPFRWAGRRCALTLDTDGSGAGDPLWAVPAVRAPSVLDPVDHPNVILISLDTLRADHLSGYGYPRATSPSLDELVIRTGAVFANAVATYPMTHISHLSIFTGLLPAALPANGVLSARAPVVTLTELLRDAGFTTLGVTEDALVSKAYGFGRGFDRLVELHPPSADRARLVFAQGRDLVRTMRHRRFFLFLHNYKVHAPYVPSPPYAMLFQTEHDGAALADVAPEFRKDRDAYDQSVRELDDEVGPFLRALDAEGLADRTLVIVLSDHGEALGEHGLRGHGFWPYEDALHAVLVFRGPGVVQRRVMTPVSLADVAPTVLDVLRLPVPSSMQGHSLKDALLGRNITLQPTFFEWNGEHRRGVRVANMKLVREGDGATMYDLARDPGENHPIDVRGRVPGMLAHPLDEYEAEGARRRARLAVPPEQPAVSPEVGQSLRALGYAE